ncbi:MAG: YfhO family protein [Lachnospiraceae bacterium]|nr:YfhO family protein [Lachnospiraceae bacterium]
MKKRWTGWGKEGFLAFFFVAGVLIFLFQRLSYAPFGTNSLAAMDANIQYLDFFAYLQDVLKGKNDIFYTFSKTLGGNNIAVFSYYLASPFNLLVVFFSKNNLHTFFDLLVVLKLGTTALTFSVFLNEVFPNQKKRGMFLLLEISYALSQYCIAQSSNIMWLDGVYMLPLILAGVHRIVYEKTGWQLSVFVGMSILFNWYTGGINCIFSMIWFFFELVFFYYEIEPAQKNRKKWIIKSGKKFFRYCFAMFLGLLLSAALFLPTISVLGNSERGSLQLDMLLDTSWIGNISSIFLNMTAGSVSSYGNVSLFCGAVACIGCMGCFFSSKIQKGLKVWIGFMLFTVIALFYWNPWYRVFSLLKEVSSYWYRYSYIGIVTIIFLAAVFYSRFVDDGKEKNWLKKSICYMLIFAFTLVELGYNAKVLFDRYHCEDADSFRTYLSEGEKQINEIKEMDSDIYRISQTSTRNTVSMHPVTSYYNEAYSLNYWSIAGYTSSPDKLQNDFLNRLGYAKCGANFCIVNDCILGADSLLGVRYILSKYPIKGLKMKKEIPRYNGKRVFENPYCLPFAFKYDGQTEPKTINDYNNPFEYQNALYSQLMGEEITLYVPVSYTKEEKEGIWNYQLTLPEGDYAIYGNLPWERTMKATLFVNEKYSTAYSGWLSSSVFYVPTNKKNTTADIKLVSDEFCILEEQFYGLNLNEMSRIKNELSKHASKKALVENGYAEFEIDGEEGENLYISIPYEDGWKVTVNEKPINAELFADCMYSIPLENGRNKVKLVYQVSSLKIGFMISVIGFLAICMVQYYEKKKQDR